MIPHLSEESSETLIDDVRGDTVVYTALICRPTSLMEVRLLGQPMVLL